MKASACLHQIPKCSRLPSSVRRTMPLARPPDATSLAYALQNHAHTLPRSPKCRMVAEQMRQDAGLTIPKHWHFEPLPETRTPLKEVPRTIPSAVLVSWADNDPTHHSPYMGPPLAGRKGCTNIGARTQTFNFKPGEFPGSRRGSSLSSVSGLSATVPLPKTRFEVKVSPPPATVFWRPKTNVIPTDGPADVLDRKDVLKNGDIEPRYFGCSSDGSERVRVCVGRLPYSSMVPSKVIHGSLLLVPRGEPLPSRQGV